MIRVLIAGPMPRIVEDITNLEAHREAIDVCGIAHQPSEIADEAHLRRPDVLLLHAGFSELTLADIAAQIEPLSPTTRVVLVPSQHGAEGGTEPAAGGGGEGDGGRLVDAILGAAGPSSGAPEADPEPLAADAGTAVQAEVSTAPRTPFYRRRLSLGRR